MAGSRKELVASLNSYSTPFQEEAQFVSRFLELLKSDRCYHRDHLPGHITGSAWIIDDAHQYVVLVHHARLNKWLQPGGHADGDEDILNVAWREVKEETGLTKLNLVNPSVFDLDIHTIPARPDFSEHLHFDIRFCFVAPANSKIIISDESHDVQWIALTEVAGRSQNNRSIIRMVQKTIGS